MAFSVAFKIWARTILINAVMMAFTVPSGIIIGGLLGALGAAAIGIFLTFPLLLVITPLVKWSIKIPYSSSARIFWLWFNLELLIVLFYVLFYGLFDTLVNSREGAFYVIATGTSVALLMSMLWTKKSLKKIITDQQ